MFRCFLCGCALPRRTPAHRVVLETRTKSYPRRPAANRPLRRVENGRVRTRRPDDPGGIGREVVREVLACAACAAKAKAKGPPGPPPPAARKG